MDYRALQHGVALLKCGQEQGSATIVAPTIAITTRHSLIDHFESTAPIELHFPGMASPVAAALHPVRIPIEEDIALLELRSPVAESSVIRLTAAHLPVGNEWQAFGFPKSGGAGAWIGGAVATWLPQGEQPQDVELSVNNFESLRSYRGYSGGPVWVAGRAAAFLQRQLHGGLAATSVLRLRRHLDAAGLEYQSAEGGRSLPTALRAIVGDARRNVQTWWALENALRGPEEGYTLLVGAPGAGKTIVAAEFVPSDPRTHVIGTYFAGGDGDPAGHAPEVHRDPTAFADWLANEAALHTGEGSSLRRAEGARTVALSVEQNLVALGQHFKSQNLLGVLIIDDFCGTIGGTIDGSLGRVLSTKPPTGLAIALTAASEAMVRSAAPHLALAHVVSMTPLDPYDCERVVAAKLQESVQSSDILRIASASDGNPLILSYLIREAQNALAIGSPLPPTEAAVPTAQAFYERQWARLSGNDAAMWLVAFAARLRGRLSERELSSLLPESAKVGLPTAWRTVGHLLRTEPDGVEVFHSSFREFVTSQTGVLDLAVHDRLAEHCAGTSDYAVTNVVYHHLLGSPAKKDLAAGLLTQDWLDSAASRFAPPAYILADVEHLLRRALAEGSLRETIRLLLARSRLRFRYGTIFGKYAFELACVVAALREVRIALRYVVYEEQLLCAPSEAVDLIRRFILSKEYEAAVSVYEALRRACIAQYQTGEISLMSWHLEAVGLLARELGPRGIADLQMLFKMVSGATPADGTDSSPFKIWVRTLPGATQLWRWGWFLQPVGYRDSARVRYCTELALIVQHALAVGRTHGVPTVEIEPPPPSDRCRSFSATQAAAELEGACRGTLLPEEIAESAIDTLVRFGREPEVVRDLFFALPDRTICMRKGNGVDANVAGLKALFRCNAVAEYLGDSSLRARALTGTREAWEQRFLDATAWLGTSHGRLCRERRASGELTIDVGPFLQMLTFTLAERALWSESYALPETVVPFLLAELSEILAEFAPMVAPDVSAWAISRVAGQGGLYTEGCRTALQALAHGMSFCDTTSARAVWRAYLAHVVECTSNREERVASLLACGDGAADLGDSELAEEALASAIKASMGPSWYKEDQLALIVDVLGKAKSPALTGAHWREVACLLECASGDLTFQRFVRNEKEALVGVLSKTGHLGEAVALARSYLWPDEQTQIARIERSPADKVNRLEGGRWGVSEVDPQACALALLQGMAASPALHRWAVIELFLPGDDRYFSSFARMMPGLFESEQAEHIKKRLLLLLVADFVPEKRAPFVKELRALGSEKISSWLISIEGRYEWARRPAEKATPRADRRRPTSSDEASEPDLFLPGLFGRPEGSRKLEEAVREGHALRAAGDSSGAREKFVEGLVAAQSAGWGIWRSSRQSQAAMRALFEAASDPAVAVRALSGVILAEEHALDWHIAEALIEAWSAGRDESFVGGELVDEVFAHTRAMLAPELTTDVEYEVRSLAQVSQPASASRAIEDFLIAALDDACCHFRERAASVLRWLLVSEAAFDLDPLLDRARLAIGRHSRELCFGIIHSWFVANRDLARAELMLRPTFALLRADPSFVARYVVAQIEGTAMVGEGEKDAVPNPAEASSAERWNWQSDCREILQKADNEAAFEAADGCLSEVCRGLEPSLATGLWKLRRNAVGAKDFWSSPREREAVWRAVRDVGATHAADLASELMWNPQWPDADLEPISSGACESIFQRVRNGMSRDCFLVAGRLVLHCQEVTYHVDKEQASQLEIVALLMPSTRFNGELDGNILYERRSTHGPAIARSSVASTAVQSAVVKFNDRRGSAGGSMTPALPSHRLLELTGAPVSAFQRSSWRDGRQWEAVGVGRALRDGTILTVEPGISLTYAGFNVAWCLLRDGKAVALVDPVRRTVFNNGGM